MFTAGLVTIGPPAGDPVATIAAGAPVRADQLTQKQRYSVEVGMPRFGFTGGVQDIP